MTQVVLNIKNKRDLPFLRKLSRNMGWTISSSEELNETTVAAIKEIENGGGTRCDSLDDYMKAVAVL